jgi:hypothetical protein
LILYQTGYPSTLKISFEIKLGPLNFNTPLEYQPHLLPLLSSLSLISSATQLLLDGLLRVYVKPGGESRLGKIAMSCERKGRLVQSCPSRGYLKIWGKLKKQNKTKPNKQTIIDLIILLSISLFEN